MQLNSVISIALLFKTFFTRGAIDAKQVRIMRSVNADVIRYYEKQGFTYFQGKIAMYRLIYGETYRSYWI
ncbi:hypothetical protein GCM10027181_05800 [Rheinheimera gaetbuli]